jgi:amidohydrolase
MPVINRIAEYHTDMQDWRRDLHMHPELGLEETRTSGVVVAKLKEFGVDDIVTGLANTGVVGVIKGQGNATKAIGLRADMDALPIVEETGLPHASQNLGKMHACGHDGHTTMLLGAAKYLAETRNFDGTVYVIFQPAEESDGGGEIMVKEGLFSRFPMDMVFGMHNWPQLPAGTFAWCDGPIMAATAEIEINIRGRGAHGAMPHLGIDPIVIGSYVITALQTIVSRTVDAARSGVVSIGQINGGHAFNVIPDSVSMRGTARWFDPPVGNQIEAGVKSLTTSIVTGFGATASIGFKRTYPATINDPEATSKARDAALSVAGEARVVPIQQPSMAAEDFAFMLNAKQGNYIWLGAGRGDENEPMLHHPQYDFNDEVLPVGASYWANLVEQMLPRSD